MPIYGYVYIIGLGIVAVAMFGTAGGMILGMPKTASVELIKIAFSGLIIAGLGTVLNLFSHFVLEGRQG